MTPRRLIVSLAVILLPASPLGAAPRHWSVAVADPGRPGRVVTAEILGPTGATAPCPVAVFGHATLTACEHYSYLVDDLAESGWLVALPTTEGGMPGDQAALAADMLVLAHSLREGGTDLPPDLPPASGGPFALLGHSLGGGAAVLAAAVDPDVGALAVLAPQNRQRPSMIMQAPHVTAPVLIVSGELDCVTPPESHHRPLHAALGSDVKAICTLAGGGHCAFAGSAEPCTEAETTCAPPLAPASQQAMTVALVRPWLSWRICGDPAAGPLLLAAAAAPGVVTETAGLPTAVAAAGPARLTPLGPSAASGSSRWALELPADASVEAAVFDLRGMRLQRIRCGSVDAGRHELSWNGIDAAGRPVAAGVYLLRVRVDRRFLQSRVVRLR